MDRRATHAVAFGSVLAGVVHLGVCPEHFREATLFGVFFAVAATLQLLWAAAVVQRAGRTMLWAGAAGQLATVGVWAISRTVGLPIGPERWVRETATPLDGFTSLIEIAVALLAIRLAIASPDPAARRLWRRVRECLPAGGVLPDDVWAQRHRWIVGALWAHVPVLLVFAIVRREPMLSVAVELGSVVVLATAAVVSRTRRRVSTVLTALGLLTCSAVLVRVSGGMIEMHFHYFVMVGVITLYQDWWPFLIAIAYVVMQHGMAGIIDPTAVYNHSEAIDHPWEWAGIHGMFIVGMSCAGIASWRLNESFLSGVVDREEKLSEAQSVAHLGSWERRLNDDVPTWSDELYRLIGVDPSETPSMSTFLARVHEDDREAVSVGLATARDQGVSFSRDFRVVLDNGEVRWLHGRAKRTDDARGGFAAVSGTVQEITERKHAEDELRDALSLLSATLDATADGILVVALDGRISSFNHRFVEMWAMPDDVLERRDDAEALSWVLRQVADPDAFLAKVRELYARPDARSEDTIEFTDGRIIERYSMPQKVAGVTVGRVWSFRDVTERKRLETELAHQAFHDSLTGLANKALFRDRVAHALSRTAPHGQLAAVLFLDLDRFKTVNDSLGHTAGDELLIAVAHRLTGCLRASDTAARLGGDEFAVLIEDVVSEDDVVTTAERVLGAFQTPFLAAGQEVFVSASIGIAFDRSAGNTDQLLRNADLAMYTSKRRGANRCEIYRPEMHDQAVDRLELESDLRRALERGELVVQYQPIVALSTHDLVGTEALVRWQHPTRGLLSPDSFIPLAEETGLIRELGRQVLDTACTQTKQWQTEFLAARNMNVSVNVSPRQLQDDELVGHVRAALAKSGLDAGCLVLEITESAMMHDTDATIAKLHELKALGVRLAVDDFGTGYSSLSYLQRFPVDTVKIDRAFVAKIDCSTDDSSLANAIVSLAHTLRLNAVAEGVETGAQADILTELGCDLAQGYLFSRPIDNTAVSDLLGRNRTGEGRAEAALPAERVGAG